jgi:Chemotaxis phosphatase CheX
MKFLTPDRLAELAVQALERTAFMIADATPVDKAALARAKRTATIRYKGPGNGTVTLRTTDDFLQSLAANLLGIEPDEVDMTTCGDDAVKELANIMGGSVILELGGRDCSYSLGLPAIVPASATLPALERTCALDCEGHPLFITWDPDATAKPLAA